ncbi:MAG: carboxypeptidase-like regulatory domain-containing protein, partial [Planctomycetota bacterium]
GRPAQITVRHARFVDAFLPASVPEERGEVRLTPSAELTVAIASGNATQLTAWLRRSARLSDWVVAAGEPSESGDWLFADLEPGEYVLAGLAEAGTLPIEAGIHLAPGAREALALEVRPGRTLSGVLRDTLGSPIEGGQLRITAQETGLPHMAERRLVFESETDAAGTFAVESLPATALQLRITAPWGSDLSRRFEMQDVLEDLEFELEAPLVLRGTVVDAGGDPLEGARVGCLRARKTGELQTFLDTLAPHHVLSDVAGEFTIESVASGEQVVVAAVPPEGRRDLSVGLLDLRADPGQGPFVVALPEQLSVSGTVFDADDGRPLSGAVVAVDLPRRRVSLTTSQTTTDGEGDFELPAPPTPLVLRASAPGYREGEVAVEDPALGEHRELRLVPVHELELTVVTAEGIAAEGVRVAVRSQPPAADASGMHRRARSDVFGQVRFDGVVAGDLTVSLTGNAWKLLAVDPPGARLPADRHLTVVVEARRRERSVTVTGSAIRAEDGGAVAALEIEGLHDGVTIRDGADFRVTGVEPGERKLRATGEGRIPIELGRRDLLPGAVVDLGVLTMHPATAVRVEVQDSEGAPVEGLRLSLLPLAEGAGGVGVESDRIRLNESQPGRYASAHGREGAWKLVLREEGRRVASETVVIETPERGPWRWTVALPR